MTLEPGSFVWATRGRDWGFRFLRDGGYEDPLPVYEEAFEGNANLSEFCAHVNGWLVVRFRDPRGRLDRSGRPIAHDFVILRQASGELPAVSEAEQVAWNSVAKDYERIWDLPGDSMT